MAPVSIKEIISKVFDYRPSQDMPQFYPRAEPPPDTICPLKRSLLSITWSCLSTIIICAWVSVHPNVPSSGRWGALRRRLKMMFWTVIAPELTLAWAMRQWFGAWEIMDAVNGTTSREGLARQLECLERLPYMLNRTCGRLCADYWRVFWH